MPEWSIGGGLENRCSLYGNPWFESLSFRNPY